MEVFFRPCNSGQNMEALPSPTMRVDMHALEDRLVAAGWQMRVNAGVLLIVKKELEATIYQTGKVVIKSRREADARSVWKELEAHLCALDAAANAA